MSKEDQTCKMSSGCKHKERKPKKPHYIPRPWGKPYNYKCFQCPFTCMEKSHLYNHMKYSLCKNSLSLLIESDWPYKKGNMLHPEQLRSLQASSRRGREDGDEQISAQKSEICFTPDELDETEDNGDLESGQKEIAEENCTTKESREHTDSSSRATIKTSKSSETDFVVTDVLSLEDQLLKARSIEVEAKLRHYKLSKTCLTGSNLLSEQWGLLATSHRKGKSEGMTPNSSIPCYPPPATFSDSPEASALNLSLLGVSYPLSPSLFSYINPAVPGASPPHPHMGQLPFLTSTAQFMHPVSNTVPHADRSLLPPRFYYPLLCEHTFGATQGDTSKPVKSGQSSTSILDTNNSPNLSSKINLWKVPALRPSPAAAWPVHEHVPSVVPEAGHRETEEKFHNGSKDCKGWSLKSTMDGPLGREHASKRTGAPLERHEQPIEKKTTPVSTVDLLKNIHFNSNLSMPPDMFLNASSFRPTHHYSRVLDEWSANLKKGFPETLYDSLKPERIVIQQEEHDAESAAVLLADLTKALQEYQEAEHKITHLPKEDHPGQRHLWQHLCKIRSELSHIHLALEKTAQQNEGPLDLSLKKDLPVISNRESQSMDRLLKESVIGETEEEEELEEEDGVEMVEKTLQNQNHSIGVFVKINQAGLTETSLGGMVKTEVLSPGGLGIRANPVEALWPSRTTKCEADSSVLLSPDGRPLVFTDFNPGAVNMKRPSSSETACPLSPLTSNDS